MEYVYKLACTAALWLLVRCNSVSSWQILQLKAVCPALTFHLDSRSADYLDMKPSVLGEAPAGIECDRVSPQFVLCLSSFVLCSLQWFTINCQTKLRSQAAAGTCGLVQAVGGKPQPTQQQHSAMCRTKLLQQHRDSRAQLSSTTLDVAAWKRRGMLGGSSQRASFSQQAFEWGQVRLRNTTCTPVLSCLVLFPPLSLGLFINEKGKVAKLWMLFLVRQIG